MSAPVFHMLSNMNRQGRMVLASPSHIFAYTVPWGFGMIRFWDTKFRYGISRCALRLGYEMLFGIRNDVRSYI